ncbi:MAG: lysophospholipid acyltransferase family protein [Bacilli bacterium]
MRALYIYFLVFVHLILVSPIVFYRYIKYIVRGNEKDYNEIYKLTNFVFSSVFKFGNIKYDVVGYDKLKSINNGFLVVANHQSYFDIPLLSLTFKNYGVSFISKDSILKVPIISHYMKIMDCLFLDRENVKSGMKMIKDGGDLLKKGVNLVIFPEGTRTDSGIMRDFKSGSLKVATRKKSVIVPVSISHSHDLHPSSWKMKKGRAIIYIHSPIDANVYSEMSVKELNDFVESTVKSEVEL